MGYEIVFGRDFQRNLKTYQKRYRHVKDDVKIAVDQLLENPWLGDAIPEGSGTCKLRVRNSDLRKGKSAGYRLIYYVQIEPHPVIYLLLLYAKSDRSDVTLQELKTLLQEAGLL
jgi:mRNA-degrading endonuclease RelE of RelBE toxin-antitoxin system